MNFWHPAYLIATGFGTGLLPKAPGTWGSLLAVVLAWPIATFLGTGGMMIAILVLIPVGIWASDRVDQTKDEDDELKRHRRSSRLSARTIQTQ